MQRFKTIITRALPLVIALGSSLITVFIDLAMLGALGDSAIAGVGLSGFLNTLILAVMLGIVPAVQGLTARGKGQGMEPDKLLRILHSGLLLAVVLGLPMLIICYSVMPYVYGRLASAPGIVEQGLPYLQVLLLAIVAQGMLNSFDGYWNGQGKIKWFMLVLLLINCLKLLGNFILIEGNWGAPALGTKGAALATVIALYSGVLCYLLITIVQTRKVFLSSMVVDQNQLMTLGRIALPVTFQQGLFSLGSVVMFWIYGLIGAAEMAAATVLIRTSMVLLVFASALGKVLATLASNSLGSSHPDDAMQWGWDVTLLGVLGISTLGAPLLFFPEQFLALFLNDVATVQLAIVPVQVIAATTGVVGISFILSNTLFSVGYGKKVALVSFLLRWCLFIPVAWVMVVHLQLGLLQVWVAQTLYGLLLVIILLQMWRAGAWQKKTL
ncbi:MATE family efflux transporter [Microbulbifer spongiae]|uniref:Multidrug-efflux transporter n=1 Tax=Microbulbifer spongiae TaxID=2944933 RepID=A0ABY9EB71_9GAMM|nr:MATE family efflux transporter [Microbulbifer sp. MI-G]WKD49186.1 MATE family efflux transporter [Microbulbifer sp. MI-G]